MIKLNCQIVLKQGKSWNFCSKKFFIKKMKKIYFTKISYLVLCYFQNKFWVNFSSNNLISGTNKNSHSSFKYELQPLNVNKHTLIDVLNIKIIKRRCLKLWKNIYCNFKIIWNLKIWMWNFEKYSFLVYITF